MSQSPFKNKRYLPFDPAIRRLWRMCANGRNPPFFPLLGVVTSEKEALCEAACARSLSRSMRLFPLPSSLPPWSQHTSGAPTALEVAQTRGWTAQDGCRITSAGPVAHVDHAPGFRATEFHDTSREPCPFPGTNVDQSSGRSPNKWGSSSTGKREVPAAFEAIQCNH